MAHSNGLEAYRVLISQNEPMTKNRSMGLLNVIMNWPPFSGGKAALMPQALRLEHAFAEYERLGATLQDDLKTAILLRSVTGQLKTWLQLQVTETTTYARVREMILLYDTSTTKWSEQMMLGNDATAPPMNDEAVAMEIDRLQGEIRRLEGKGKGKGKGKDGKPKGKGQENKGYQKGKGKGKQKGEKGSKGKSKGYAGKGKGNSGDRSKGTSKAEGVKCHNCGKYGHFARDCWDNVQVRQVNTDGTQATTAQGSRTHSTAGSTTSTSVSQQQPGAQQAQKPATQYRVARIRQTGDDVKGQEEAWKKLEKMKPKCVIFNNPSPNAKRNQIFKFCLEVMKWQQREGRNYLVIAPARSNFEYFLFPTPYSSLLKGKAVFKILDIEILSIVMTSVDG